MKTNIEIVTGFLGSGKTTFINKLIENTLVSQERVIVIQWERGQQQIASAISKNNQISIKVFDPQESFSMQKLKFFISAYNPHRIIIEHNGTRKLGELIEILRSKDIRSLCSISSIYHITDATTFELFINTMGRILQDSIQFSDLIVINNVEGLQPSKREDILNKIKSLNPQAYIIELLDITQLNEILRLENILEGGMVKRYKVKLRNLILKYVKPVYH
jgi:G3E family GTPase